MFGLNDVYPKLVPYLRDRRQAGDPLYIVSANIKTCFDNIVSKKILEAGMSGITVLPASFDFMLSAFL